MHLFSRHDLEPVPKIPMLQTLVTISSQSQQINISKRFNLLWKSVMQCTFLRCKSIPEKVSPSHIIHFRANWTSFEWKSVLLIQGIIQINAIVSFYNFDQYEDSSFQVFLQSDQAGWDNSAKKLKNRNNLVVSLYVYQFSTVVDFSSEKYSGSTVHRNS